MSLSPAHKSRGLLISKPFLLAVLLSALPTIVSAFSPQDKPPAERQEPSIKLKAELVETRVVVTDRKGNVIKNLNKEDFEVFENDHRQDISFFSAENLGGTKDQIKPSQAVGNHAPVNTPGRTIVFYIDTLHLSTISLLETKGMLLKFIDERLTGNDVVAVVSSSGSLGIFGQFTQDKEVLRNAINRLSASPESRPNTLYSPFLAGKVENEAHEDGVNPLSALEVAMNIVRAEESLPDDPTFRGIVKSIALSRAREILAESTYRRRSTLLTLKSIAERLADMRGQRLILMLSDGFTMVDNNGTSDSADVRLATSRASRSGVIIYTFGAQGLKASALFSASNGGRFSPDPQSANRITSLVQAGERELEGGLQILAKETGGESFLTTNDLTGALRKAIDDNSFYYALSYYPSDNDKQKAFRRIKVRVKGHTDYNVRTQKGYFAEDLSKERLSDDKDPQKRLLQAMNSPFVNSQVEVDAAADFLDLQADGAQVSLHTFTYGKKLKYVKENNGFVSRLAILVEVINSRGRAESITQDAVQIRLSPEQYKEVEQNVYRQVKRIQLKPGLYQIRVGVQDQATDLIGTAMAWVEVPDLKSKKLALSSLSLGRIQEGKTAPQAELKKAVIQPAVKRGISIFRVADYIAYFSRAYGDFSNEKASDDLSVQAQILQGERVVLEDAWRPLSSLITAGEKSSLEFGNQISLTTLQPGIYELRITIKDKKSERGISQTKSFEVQP